MAGQDGAALSAEMQRFVRRIGRQYRLRDHQRALLHEAAVALDRAREARELVKLQGLTVTTARGGARPHPALAIENAAAIRAARLLRELGLAPRDDSRPPRLGGRYQGRR